MTEIRENDIGGREEQNLPALVSGEVGHTLYRLTIPMIVGIVSMVAFNIVDTIYISMLGLRELAALSFTFPVVTVISSLALGIGMGASTVISRAIGGGQIDRARRLTTDSLILAVSLVAICVALGLATIKPLFSALGASEDIIELISQYMTIWYPAMLFIVVPMTSNNAIRACGDTRTPATIMLTAVVINAVLDPLMIFGIGPFPALGMKGAALATMLSRAITMVLSLYILKWRRNMLTFRIPGLEELKGSWGPIVSIAIPAAATRLILPLGAGILTRIAANFGNAAVAAMGVASRLEFMVLAVVMSLASVMGPFTGQNLGAQRFERIRSAISISNRFALKWGLVSAVIMMSLSGVIASFFGKDPETADALKRYLLIVPLGFGMQGIFLLGASVLNVFERAGTATALSFTQMMVMNVPLAWLLSRYMGMAGIFTATLISFLVGGAIAFRTVWGVVNEICPEQPLRKTRISSDN